MRKGKSNSRTLALETLIEFYRAKKDAAAILNGIVPIDISEKDMALLWEMTMGSIKLKKRLEFIAQAYVKAPMSRQRIDIRAALILGLYQLTEMSAVPEFAAVDETVSAVKNIASEKAAGFVNAVLRAYLTNPGRVRFPDKNKEPKKYLSLFYSYPPWLVRKWLERLGGEEAEMLLNAGNSRPRFFFKILESKISRQDVNHILADEGIGISSGDYFPDYFRSNDSRIILNHYLFAGGNLIVQDESQGIPAYLLDPPPGSTILDLCAAPGGKTIALADRVGEKGKVIAVDYSPHRLKELKDNVTRTGFNNIEMHESDLLEFNPPGKFGYILLDVPCSALGTISANADLRWTKTKKDVMILSEMQKRLLRKTAEFTAEDGVIVYSTCTTEPEEIEEVVFDFLNNNREFKLENGNSSFLELFKTETGVYRSWPHKHGIGGGGFARLRRSG